MTPSDFKQQAISLNACIDIHTMWTDDMAEMYLRGVNFCMKNKFPSLEDMKPYESELEKKHIYNSKEISLELTDRTYVLNNCKARVKIGDYTVSQLYVSRDSIVEVKVNDNAILLIDCYDNAVIRLHVSDMAKCVVTKYGNSVVQLISGNSKIKQG